MMTLNGITQSSNPNHQTSVAIVHSRVIHRGIEVHGPRGPVFGSPPEWQLTINGEYSFEVLVFN